MTLAEVRGESSAVKPLGQPRGFFSSLQYPGSMVLWLSHITASSQFWMEMIARPWLVYQMTDSVLLLGVVQAVRGVPVLVFSGLGGLLADRMDRRKLYLVVRTGNSGAIVLLAFLLVTGHLEVWHVFALTAAEGIFNAAEFPIRQSLIPAVVPESALMNAIALHSVGRQLTHLVAPSIAGVLIAAVGIGGTYVVQSVVAIAAVAMTLLLRVPSGSQSAARESIAQNVMGALRYLRGRDVILTLLVLSLAQRFCTGSSQTLFPAFARDIHQVGEVGFGLLNSAIGGGAFLGALGIAVMGSVQRKGAILLVGAVLQAVGLILFAYSPSFPLALVLTGLVGIVQTAYFTMNSALLLGRVSEEYRGRVLSIYDMDRGIAPLGAVTLGWLAEVAGAPAAVALLAVPMIPITLTVLWRVPRFRDAE